MPRIFDGLYLMERARHNPKSGNGLGLAIVKSIMQLHGGVADTASAPGGPTTIWLEFPALRRPRVFRLARGRHSPASPANTRCMRASARLPSARSWWPRIRTGQCSALEASSQRMRT
ncbi:MAG: ATP-binding protein [Pseudomonadota bacterium]